MEFEREWEMGFNLFIRLSLPVTQIGDWCCSDEQVLYRAVRAVAADLEKRNPRNHCPLVERTAFVSA